jgi:predicted GIY-YIG superfamily endonuclease
VPVIYVLQLQGENWYVGTTSNDLACRLDQHASGFGAAWTRAHPPVKVHWTKTVPADDALRLEDAATRVLIRRHGRERVRGGRYI